MNAFAGAVTSAQYLRGNGTNVVMSAIQASDVPTLNQSTTGNAANVTGTVAIGNGGTGSSTAVSARNNLGIQLKTTCRYATSNPLPANTATSSSVLTGSANGALSVDGVAVSSGIRILVKDEVLTRNNGVYTVTSAGSASSVFVLTRPTDYSSVSQITAGDIIPVLLGSTLADTLWQQKSTVTTIGADPITFSSITSGSAVQIANGGTGETTQQAAINALTGTQVAGRFLRSNGTNAVLEAINASDVPVLNQSTTGTAANVTGTVAIANGGTGAATAQSAISNLGVGMRMVEAQTNANIPGTMVGNVFTAATGVFTTDGYTPVLGDIIAFTLQGGGSTSIQNGFWEVTTVGAAGIPAVFTRPTWFANASTVRNGMYMTRFGTTQSGYVMAFYGVSADIIVGTTAITVVRVNSRNPNATTAINLFSGYQTFRANGSSANQAPFFFQTGANLMTTPQANAVEWFSDQMYLTNAAGVRTTNTNHVAIPASAAATGQVGQIAVDNTGSWLYVCTATNVWKRVLLTTF